MSDRQLMAYFTYDFVGRDLKHAIDGDRRDCGGADEDGHPLNERDQLAHDLTEVPRAPNDGQQGQGHADNAEQQV